MKEVEVLRTHENFSEWCGCPWGAGMGRHVEGLAQGVPVYTCCGALVVQVWVLRFAPPASGLFS